MAIGALAQLVERFHGMEEVRSSILLSSTQFCSHFHAAPRVGEVQPLSGDVTLSNKEIERAREDAELRRHVGIALEAAEDRKAENTTAFFVGDVMGITDWFVVTSGSNPRQVRAIVENIEAELTRSGVKPLRVEGLDSLTWVLMDFGGFVVHVFHAETRSYYNLERLWSDVPRFETQSA